MQRDHRVDLVVAGQHPALELEVVEAVALAGGFGQPHHGFGRHRRFVAHAEPGVVGARVFGIGQIGLVPVADVEQIAEHLHRVALLAFAEQCGHRHVEVLAEQVEQRRFDRRDRMDGGAQVEGLQPAAATVAVGEGLLHLLQQALVRTQRLADDQRGRVFQRLADLLAARHLADTAAAGAVAEDQQVAREERPVCAAQVEQHAVAAGDRDHAQGGDDGSG